MFGRAAIILLILLVSLRLAFGLCMRYNEIKPERNTKAMSEAVRENIAEETAAAPELKQAPDMPMAWHKFLVKCMLWITAAYHVFQCIWIYTGGIYYTPAVREAVYTGLPAMQFIDQGLAACMFAAAALQLLARTALSRRHARGPKMLAASYIVLLAGWTVYVMVRWLLVGLSPLSLSVFSQMLSCLMLLLINLAYYRRRRSIFSSNDD